MTLKCHLLLWIVGLATWSSNMAEAAPPWQRMIPFKRVDADADKSYSLTEQCGPWMIMATTFRGDNAEVQANDLVHELRSQFKLPAYTHKKVYDFTGTVAGRGVAPDGSPRRMRYAQEGTVEEVAVLVGDYGTVDDPTAQKTLQKLKYAQPESLAVDRGKGTSQSFAQLRRWQQSIMRTGDEDKKKGPMRHAFITTNPLLPKEYFAPKGVDKMVLDMNKDVEHSLLDCKGKYTVKIATFTGKVVLDPHEIERLEEDHNWDGSNSSLAKAAIRAHKLTTALRSQGVEAYEFHDRETSIVTIGSFDSVGSPRPDGKIEINPQIHAIMKEYGAQEASAAVQLTSGTAAPGLRARRVAGVTLDIQPMPVEVPKRSFATDYRKTSY